MLRLGAPVVSRKFTEELNEALLAAERQKTERYITSAADAFGQAYYPIEDVMPNIRIGAGFFVKARTMNKNIPCLHKYKQDGSQTYPASNSSRLHLQQALNYIARIENEGKTWICIDTVEKRPRDILFAYPLQLNQVPENFAKMFERPKSSDTSIPFSGQAQKLICELKNPCNADGTSNAENIRIFILRRLNVDNSGRAKVIYTRQTDANELEKCSKALTYGCANLPAFPFETPQTPYPLDVADILNRFWKQNGEIATDKFKPFSKYHGLELLLEPNLSVTSDLHRLSESAMNIGPQLGNLCAKKEFHRTIWVSDGSDTDWTLVATSCVETGVDFSFRTGFREISSLPSLLQAAGRVKRHGDCVNAEMWSFSLRDDSVLTRNNGLKYSAAVLHNYFQNGISIVPELSTRSMNDEIIRNDSCIKTIRQLMVQEDAMQFQTVDRAFTVIDSDMVPAIIDGSLAEAIVRGKSDWHTLQKKSVCIRRDKIKEWNLKEIVDGVYLWSLGYDDFLGYMCGVLNTLSYTYEDSARMAFSK